MQRTYFPLTHAQKRIWYTEQFYPKTSVSNLCGVLKLESATAMDNSLLLRAIHRVVMANDAMRLRLEFDDAAEPKQYVAEYEDFQVDFIDFSDSGDTQAAMAWAQAEARQPLGLRENRLFHFAVLKINSTESFVFACIHHLICDGISIVLVANQIIDNYLELIKPNQENELFTEQPSYTEYILSESNYTKSKRFLKDRDHWNKQFVSVPELASLLPSDSRVTSTVAVRLSKTVSPLLHKDIQEFCQENGISPLALFLSVLCIYLHRVTGQDDVTVGTFMGNRTNAREKQMLGMFVSTIPIQAHVDDERQVINFVRDNMLELLTVIRHQKYPYNVLTKDLREKHGQLTRLFGISLEYQVMQAQKRENLSFIIEPLFCGHEVNDISIHVKDRLDNGSLHIDLDYRSELFTEAEMEDLFRRLMTLLAGALSPSNKKIAELEWVSEAEKQQVLSPLCSTQVSYDEDATIHSLFERQCAANPEHTAIVYEGTQVTFNELNTRSNGLARILRRKGVTANTPVAILMERSERVIVAIMGVLKAGGAYVPIDPGFPEDRIRFILEDSRAHVLITESDVVGHFNLSIPEQLLLDGELSNLGDVENLESTTHGHDLAYIIYTSGTTGKPKGVMIEHRQVHHLMVGLYDHVYSVYDLALKVALLAPFHFDASVQQLFASLLFGHTLFIVPKTSVSDGRALSDFYRTHGIDVTDGTPAHLQLLVSTANLQGVQLRNMLIGGAALPRRTVTDLLDLFAANGQTPTITNVYGPTESCVDASAYHVRPADWAGMKGHYVPIGRPLANNRFYVLDAHGRMQPDGVPGELYIAGGGVGRGYLNLVELTAEKFVADPFVSGATMYKTGDLVYRLPDGNLMFVGRTDDQVKIRGYRIELGEIESILRKHRDIGTAVVLARPEMNQVDSSEREICAYIVWKDPLQPVSIAELRGHLALQLPAYMLPSYFVELDEIPLTSSGKVDRQALLRCEITAVSRRQYVAPTNETEAGLIQVWQEVLCIERIGVHDDFFELGGHSLNAITLLSRTHQVFDVEVPLQVLFATPNVHSVAEYIVGAERKSYRSIDPVELRDAYPLSFAQQRVYIASQFADTGIAYNMPAIVQIEGALDVTRLEWVFQELIVRHEALRTTFASVNGTPSQTVHRHVPFEMTVFEQGGQRIDSILTSFIRPFDLSQAPLMRMGLLRLGERKHQLLFDMHHLVSDGVSIGIIVREWARLYHGELLPAPRLQYKDYAVWQVNQASQGFAVDDAYWTTMLGGELPVLQLLSDYPRPPVQSFLGDRVSVVLDQALQDKLNRFAREHGTTLYTVLLTTYYVLLAKYTGQDDIIVGTPTAGRNHADLEDMVGMFVNTLAIRSQIHRHDTFAHLLDRVQHTVLNAFEHQNYPFEWLVEKLQLPRDLSRNPVFDTMFILQDAFEQVPQMRGMRVSLEETDFHIAKFDLTVQVSEKRDGLAVDMDYSVQLFRQNTVERMLTHYANLLASVVENPNRTLGELHYLSGAETHQLLVSFNPVATEYPKQRTIVQLFEEQVDLSPDHPVLVYEGHTLAYAELNQTANQLARTLQSKGVHSGTVVGVLARRSVEMIVGILAILKAGGAYAPIDPEHPTQRIQHFLSDSGATLLLTQHNLHPLVQDVQFHGEVVFADDPDLYVGDTSNLHTVIAAHQLANLTYTSGTTGTPKGNMITHANIIRTVKNANYVAISNQDTVLSLSNYVFDAFMFDLFGALTNGAKLVLIPKQVILDISRLTQVIEEQRITILMITTALFNLLVDARPDCIVGIRKLLFGGERASVDHVRKALRITGPGKLLHMYGPSESTVFATYYPVDELANDAITIPIGKPVSNTTAYILDAFNQLQPIGTAGELCVGGDGLALGYFNRPELTLEKFVSHPFLPHERLYRTGDLARWLPDGNIEFIGRIDHQVKIRGQRIEVGEIEHQLLRHERIREAVVLSVDNATGEQQLCAYIVGDTPLSVAELRQHANQQLPAYMVPSIFIQLQALPLTGSGKVDRRRLPQPDLSLSSRPEYVAPHNEVESQLVTIWQELLGIGQVGVHDNFFELGGHSLKAMTLLARVHRDMFVALSLKALFQSPTVAGFAEVIMKSDVESYVSITPAAPQAVYPVSSAQRRLYALQQLNGAELSYNMPSVLRLEGALSRERLEFAIRQLLSRHEALRTSFEMVEGQPVQTIRSEVDVTVTYLEASEAEVPRHIAEFIRPFELQSSPLFRVGLIRIGDKQHLLLVDMHHIISDGVSVSVLLEEITRLYAGETLHPIPIQYKDYAVWQQSFMQTQSFRDEESYWLEQLAGELPVLNLPTDFKRSATQSFSGDRIDFTLDSELTKSLRKLAQETGTTMFMVLLASYSAFLANLSGQRDVVVGTPISGRRHPDLARIVGMFVNTLAMRTSPQANKTFAEYLQEVKNAVLTAFECQDYPLEELVRKVDARRDISRNPLFDTVFTLQSVNLKSFTLDGIRTEAYPFEHNVAKFDLMLTAIEEGDFIRFELDYNTGLFKSETMVRWSGHFKQLLGQFSRDPAVNLAEVNLLTQAEQHQILVGFNDTERVYPRALTIHELFEAQVERTPYHAAVVLNDEVITYETLNARANRLARSLRTNGLKVDGIVGIMMEPSIDMVIGIVAILKAGGAYLPIDPDYPEDRVRYLVTDSNTATVLTQRKFAARLTGIQQLWIDDPELEMAESTNLTSVNRPDDLAYVIYTSGSTGQPKGVMVEHRNVVCLVKNAGYIPFDETCRMAQTGSISFDASTFELFATLLHGGALYLVPKPTLTNVLELAQFLQQHRITTMWLTSPLFNQLAKENPEMFNSLRHLIVGGDALVPGHVNQVRRVCPRLSLWNGYGPTENTTFSTCFLIDEDFSESIPIGKPIGNSTAYILSSTNRPQPIGVPGELCVGGDGVARGYLNRPDLTKHKFVDNPFAPGTRMYRTGDLARWLQNGNIEFLGRMDGQVKVRGFRIELGEVESQLMQVDGVEEVVVTVHTDEFSQNALCAYVIGKRPLTTGELRDELSRLLPSHMVPSYFVQLDKLPLKQNGKVDRAALPDPDVDAGRDTYRGPRNEKEELLCLIWQDVLGSKQVGIGDNFFSLGGDSIKAIQMGARLHQHGWKLDMKDLFQQPTVEQASRYLQSIKGDQVNQDAVEGEVPLTPIQRWFFNRRFTDMHHWNQSVMLFAAHGFEPRFVEQTLRKIVEHHDALRMVFTVEGERVMQYNRGAAECAPELEVIQVSVSPDEVEQAILLETERIQGSIDLSHGPLLKAVLFQTNEGDHLLIVIHHLVVDGVSWRIFLEDFTSGYLQVANGTTVTLPDKTHSYQEWAGQLEEYSNSEQFRKEIDYWRQLEDMTVLPLPKDFEASNQRMENTRTVEFSLTANETDELTTRVHLAYHTEINDILLTSLGYAVRDWTGYREIPILLEGHGREEIIKDVNVSRTIGWFTTQYPVLLDMNHSFDLGYQLKRVKEDLRHVPYKGIGYGLLRYSTDPELRTQLSFALTPEISFNYLGEFSPSMGGGSIGQSPLSTGNALHPNSEKMTPIDIVGFNADGALKITFAYNSLEYADHTMIRLCQSFKSHLMNLIEHCVSREDGELTPSDLGDDELTLEELDALLKIL